MRRARIGAPSLQGPGVLPVGADMETAIAQALAVAGDVDATYVFVTAAGTGVTLSGWVATTEELERASVICATIAGPAAVTNRLQIG